MRWTVSQARMPAMMPIFITAGHQPADKGTLVAPATMIHYNAKIVSTYCALPRASAKLMVFSQALTLSFRDY